MTETRRDIRKAAEKHKEKLLKIKVLLTDCDGVLTDGRLYYAGEEIGFNRWFNARDGYGLKLLQSFGIKVGVITGGDSTGLRKRLDGLGVDYQFLGNEDKLNAYDQVKADSGCSDEEIVYIGDDLFDLPVLRQVGFSATVPDTVIELREFADYTTEAKAGMGAVREVIDLIRYAQELIPNL